MLVPMAKVQIVGPKQEFFEVLGLIHEHGRLHIEDLAKRISSRELPIERMEIVEEQRVEKERLEDLTLRVRAVLAALDHGRARVDSAERRREYERLSGLGPAVLEAEIARVIDDVEHRTASLAAARTDLEAELLLLERYEPILQKIQPLAKQIVATGGYESTALLIEQRYRSAMEVLKAELDRITNRQCEVVSADVDDDLTAVIVVYSKVCSEAVHTFLAMENINQVRLPSEFEGMPFDIAYAHLKERRAELPVRIERVSAELDGLSQKWLLTLLSIRDVVADKVAEIAVIPSFGRTEYAFVIDGWMPEKDVQGLRAALRERWGERIVVTQTEIREDQFADTPVAVVNPRVIAPFEELMKVRGVPRYGTVDPTWLLFIFFPLFYGLIVGDFGYGAVMLAVILWLRRRFRGNELVHAATSILGPAATMVVVFGFVYGEGFGDLPITLGWVTIDKVTHASAWFGVIPTFHRVDLVMPFLYLALFIGVTHVLLGLALGMLNAVRTGHRKHLWERGGVFVFLVAILSAVGIGFEGVRGHLGHEGQIIAQGVLALIAAGGFFYAIRGGGVMGVVETMESVVHIASYLRIMAVGLAGGIFAEAINQIVVIMGNPVIGIFVGIVLHALHIVIASFSPLIHALRLNLLEFFGKFYEAGKEPYKPFVKSGGEKVV